MTDPFLNMQPSLTAPASHGFAVTPGDATDFARPTRALYVGGDGNLAVRLIDGQILTFVAVPAGSFLPLRVNRVLATGTTATNIIGLA